MECQVGHFRIGQWGPSIMRLLQPTCHRAQRCSLPAFGRQQSAVCWLCLPFVTAIPWYRVHALLDCTSYRVLASGLLHPYHVGPLLLAAAALSGVFFLGGGST